MKHHDGGLRGGHKRIGRGPVRRVCFTCQGEYIGLYPECASCRRQVIVRALPVRHEPDDEPPPRAA